MSDDVTDDPPQEAESPSSDEDWKAQVEAERAAADEEPVPDGEPADEAATEEAADEAGEAATEEEPVVEKEQPAEAASDAAELEMPPATLELLCATLATQAMVALGQGGEAEGDTTATSIGMARHCIDMLALLEDKTEGNRSDAETAMLANMLHQLRLLCLNVEALAAQGGDTADED